MPNVISITANVTGAKSGYVISYSDDGLAMAMGDRGTDQGGRSRGHAHIYKYINDEWIQQGPDGKTPSCYFPAVLNVLSFLIHETFIFVRFFFQWKAMPTETTLDLLWPFREMLRASRPGLLTTELCKVMLDKLLLTIFKLFSRMLHVANSRPEIKMHMNKYKN